MLDSFLATLQPMLTSPVMLGLGALVIVLLGLTALLGGRRRALPYAARETLITNAERKFLAVLDEACGRHYRVFAQVRVGDVLKVSGVQDRSAATTARNRINSKHIDFVVVERTSMRIAFCVELDDRSHQRRDRRERDDFLNAAFAAADLPLLRVPCRERYDVGELRATIQAAMAGQKEQRR